MTFAYYIFILVYVLYRFKFEVVLEALKKVSFHIGENKRKKQFSYFLFIIYLDIVSVKVTYRSHENKYGKKIFY